MDNIVNVLTDAFQRLQVGAELVRQARDAAVQLLDAGNQDDQQQPQPPAPQQSPDSQQQPASQQPPDSQQIYVYERPYDIPRHGLAPNYAEIPPLQTFTAMDSNLRFNIIFAENYYRVCEPNVQRLVNMFRINGFNNETANTLMYAHSTTVWNILKVIDNYLRIPVTECGLKQLQDWNLTKQAFQPDRIKLRDSVTSTDAYFNVYIARLFPSEEQLDIPYYCSYLLSRKTQKRNLVAHVAYIFIMANLIEANKIQEAAAFNDLVVKAFIELFDYIPMIDGAFKWVTRKEGFGPGKLQFIKRPY